MSTRTRAAAFLVWVFLDTASLTLLAQKAESRAAAMPEGPGQSLVTVLCAGCHTLDVTLGKRATAAEWRATVQSMIDRGARITSDDAATLATYLGEHYGPTAATAGAPAAPPSRKVLALPDAPGKDVLMKKCFQCHQMIMWSALQQDRRAWQAVLYRMIGRGALWTEQEIDAMAGYLERAAGPAAAGRK